MKPILAGMIAIASIAGAVSGAQAQSFNCRKAYFADEKLICMSPDLSRLDERLDRVFGQTRSGLSPAGRSALDREEERWVVGRRRCGTDHRCIEDSYRDRIGELAGRLDNARGDVRSEARRGYRDNRGEPPVARRERQREVSPSERVAPEPPRSEPRRERPVAAEPIESDRIEHSTAQREAPASSPSRQSNGEERTNREERASRTEQTTARRPPLPTNGKRQPAPVQAESASQPAASTAPQPSSRRQATARSANTAPPPEAASGSGMPRPRIEFADPPSGPMSPAR